MSKNQNYLKKIKNLKNQKYIIKYMYEKRCGIMAFFIPFFTVLIAYISLGIYPFGERAVNIIDSYHQYAPFFSEFYNKIIHGGSLLYSWNGGLGINFWSIIVYYLSSPLNILILLFPRKYLLEAFALIIMLKISLSGWSFSFYIKKHYKKNNTSIIFLSSFYALSAWMLGYNWNIMWLDCIVLFPLIILGFEQLMNGKSGILYTITLGMSICFNYYISIMICIFLVIYFFVLFIQKRTRSFRILIKRGVNFAGYSLLAGGLAAVMLLPELYTLMMTHSADSEFPTKIKFYNNFLDILGQQFAFVEPTNLSGLPNLYCGVFALMSFILYFFRRKTPLRYKVTRIVLVVFLVFSCNVNVLNFIWHGFHYPNSLPNRFTFIYVFVLLTISYEVILSVKQYRLWQLFTGFMISELLILLVYLKGNEEREVYVYLISMGLIWGYMVVLCLLNVRPHRKQVLSAVCCLLLSLEAVCNGIFGIYMNGSIDRTTYNKKLEDAAKIQNYLDDINDNDLYRVELDQFNGRNNAMWLGLKSVSMFSSTLSEGLNDMIKSFGFFSAVNKFSYEGATELTDDVLNVKYLISEKEKEKIRGFEYLTQIGDLYLYQNTHDTSIAFMVNKNYKDFVYSHKYPWVNLNEFIKCTTTIQENLFDIEYIPGEPKAEGWTLTKQDEFTYSAHKEDDETSVVEYIYCPTYQNERYLYYKAPHMKKIKVEINGVSKSYRDTRGHVIDLGNIGAQDTVKITFELNKDYKSADIMMALFKMNTDVYEQANSILASNTMKVLDYSDTWIKGQINVEKAGIMLTSIPYDKGWKIKVDGQNVNTYSVDRSFIYIYLDQGEHVIEMNYMPQGFKLGFGISAISLVILSILIMRNKRNM